MTQAALKTDVTAQNVDLTNCDREPIHIPGTVQSHGVLLVCNGPEQRIAHASENLQLMLDDAPEYVLGKPLSAVIGLAAASALVTGLETAQASIRARIFNLALDNGKRCHASIVNHAGRFIVELEPSADFDADAARPVELVGALLSQMQKIGSVEKLCSLAAERMRTLIQYDRIMIYRFLHNGSGQVIAESKRADLTAFLGLHYPASDIPQQARALYLKSWIRLIADVNTQPIPIIPEHDASGQAVDLSFAALRSVSPIHIEYLRNMGVAASMSISIIVGGKLWGLIACHNYTPKIVPADIRAAAELFGQIFSLQIESLEPSDRADLVRIARVRIDKMLSEFPTAGSLLENLTPRLGDLRTLIPCDGAGLWIDGIWKCQGTAPPDREIPALARFVIDSSGGEVFATHELANRLPAAASYAQQASGLLAIPLSRTARDYLMLFRHEIVHTVKWAGDPNKPVTVGPRGDRLTPRKSFETWESDVRGQSLPWEQSDRLTAEALRISLLEVVLRLTEVAARERAAAADRQRLLIAELNHRVKNILGLISALVSQGRDKEETLTSFVTGLQGRIRALAFAHDQAAQDGAGSISQLFENETAPYRRNQLGAIVCNGPPVAIDAQAFSVLALVVHEMATNAAKYGALSVPNANLTVAWRLDELGNCVIEWQESGGPAVQSPGRTGFGTTLIERQIPFELNGETDVHYELTGLRARFVIPAKHVVENSAPMPLAATSRPEYPSVAATLSGLDILLVEDSLLIALDAETMLRNSGAASVEVVNNAGAALAYITSNSCSAAVLDINLGRGTSMPVADELAKRGIPFIFASGYSDPAMIPERHRHVTIVGKPYSAAGLSRAISEAVGRVTSQIHPRVFGTN
jgi:light-regulated signal transduction histidine kinase (bacteriophytochrome)/CheY-like chemotaxis protein